MHNVPMLYACMLCTPFLFNSNLLALQSQIVPNVCISVVYLTQFMRPSVFRLRYSQYSRNLDDLRSPMAVHPLFSCVCVCSVLSGKAGGPVESGGLRCPTVSLLAVRSRHQLHQDRGLRSGATRRGAKPGGAKRTKHAKSLKIP